MYCPAALAGRFFLLPIPYRKLAIANNADVKKLIVAFTVSRPLQFLDRRKDRHIGHARTAFALLIPGERVGDARFKIIADDFSAERAAHRNQLGAVFYGRIGVINHHRTAFAERRFDELLLPAIAVLRVGQQIFADVAMGVSEARVIKRALARGLQPCEDDELRSLAVG